MTAPVRAQNMIMNVTKKQKKSDDDPVNTQINILFDDGKLLGEARRVWKRDITLRARDEGPLIITSTSR
jgi:hypothetical protein